MASKISVEKKNKQKQIVKKKTSHAIINPAVAPLKSPKPWFPHHDPRSMTVGLWAAVDTWWFFEQV